MQNYAKVGGILSIVAGAFAVFYLLGLVFMILAFLVFSVDADYYHDSWSDDFPRFIFVFYAIVMGGYVILGGLAVAGGIFALRRQYWGWALAGAIAGTITFMPCGIPAIVFTAMAKPEFQPANTPSIQSPM